MARKTFFILLAGIVLLSGTVYAEQSDTKAAKVDPTIQMRMVDEPYGVRDGDLYRFDADRGPWVTRHAKAVTYDTIVHFTGENNNWYDRIMTTAEWDTIDATNIPSMWHISDYNACHGDSAWLCNDPDIGTEGGYADDWWQILTSDWIVNIDDSTFLVYDHWVKCEHNDNFPWSYGWDGYQVRVAVKGGDFAEVLPYQVADDSSYYRGGRYYGEWDSLWAMGYHEEKGGGFGWNEETSCSFKTFDLRPYAGDTIAVRFIFATDGAYNTLDEDSLFGLILDNILVVDDVDSTILANLPVVGGDTLLYEDNEGGGTNQFTPTVPTPTGSYWWLAFGGYDGSVYKAMDSEASGTYVPNMEDRLASPWIKKADLDTNLADLLLDYYLRGNFNDDDPWPGVDYVYNEFRLDKNPWSGVSLLTDNTNWVFHDFDDSDWWDIDQWDESMHDLTPLLDSTGWDSMQVAVHVHTDGDVDAGAVGLQVDEVLVYGRIGFPNDIGVSAVKLPSPNANDIALVIDTVTVENYGFNTAASGGYVVKMAIVDSNGVIVDSAATISLYPPPAIDPLEIASVPCDPTTSTFTLNEEGSYDFLIWTEFTGGTTDDDPSNDTLATEYTTKALYYPGVFNYPAGQGQIRYHDQGFYNYPYINVRIMDTLEVAAVHFDPDPSFYPFDCRLALPNMVNLEDEPIYNFKVYGPGVDDDHPGAEWYSIPIQSDGSGDLDSWRIELDTLDMLQHMSGDFWFGIEFPTGTDDYVMGLESAANQTLGRNWGHSYMYQDTAGTKQMDWVKRDNDWVFTAVISWRTIDAECMPSLSGPSKNSSGNLYIDWDDVSQAWGYTIYRSTNIDSPFALIDTAFVSNYTDTDAVGTVGTDYFYLFHTVDDSAGTAQGIYDKTSAAIGEFDESLSNMK